MFLSPPLKIFVKRMYSLGNKSVPSIQVLCGLSDQPYGSYEPHRIQSLITDTWKYNPIEATISALRPDEEIDYGHVL